MMGIDITRIEIKIPHKGSVFLVDNNLEDSFEGDGAAISYIYQLFDEAERNGITYSYADHSKIITRKVTTADIFNCDAIRDVLRYNNIDVPDNFPTDASRFIELNTIYGFEVVF